MLAILVFADNDVQNRIIQTRRAYDAGELERVSNYLNHNFARAPAVADPGGPGARAEGRA